MEPDLIPEPRTISLADLIAEADREIAESLRNEQAYLVEIARWQGDRARAEAWRERLIAIAQAG